MAQKINIIRLDSLNQASLITRLSFIFRSPYYIFRPQFFVTHFQPEKIRAQCVLVYYSTSLNYGLYSMYWKRVVLLLYVVIVVSREEVEGTRAPPTTNSTSLVRSTPRPRWFLGSGATTPLPPSSSSHVSHNHLLECRLHLQTVRGPTESLPNTIRKIIRRRRILIILTSIYSYHRRFLWIAAGKTFERTIQSQKCQIL